MLRSSLAVAATLAATIGILAPGNANALDAVLCVNVKGNGPPKFRAAKTNPPAPAACKTTEIQIGHFDGTTLQFTAINVQIVSGSGATDGAVNGKGNLIVGYNRATSQTRTGSHNLVVGDGHEYTSYGGLVAGEYNTTSAPFASVCGGSDNTASGNYASVSGGYHSIASGYDASVSGGSYNTASGGNASVSGGSYNTASGHDASVSGGAGLGQPVANGWAAGSLSPSNVVVGNFESP